MPLAIVRLQFLFHLIIVRILHRSVIESLILLLILAPIATVRAPGQSTTDGTIAGTVADPSGALIAGAALTATSDATLSVYRTRADASGVFQFPGLPPGTYRLEIALAAYAPYLAKEVMVEVGRTTTISATLAIGGSQETVVVKDRSPGIDTTSAAIASNLDEDAVHGLPSNGRRWSDFALLTPTVVSDQQGYGLLSFRGIGALLNNNTMDGADNNQAFFSEERGRSSVAYSTSEASVREFQVNAANYSAEYGRAAGGVVNTVTHSGSNTLHGSTFLYDRDSQLGAQNPYSELTKLAGPGNFVPSPFTPSDTREQWGSSIGGPIRKDRLFGFFTYDQYRRNFPAVSQPGNAAKFYAGPTNNELTTLAERLGLPLNSMALADFDSVLAGLATETGIVPRSANQLVLFPKLDYHPDERNHFTSQFNHMQWNSPNGVQTQTSTQFGVASFGNSIVKDDWGIMRWNAFVSASRMNDLLLQYGRDFEAQLSTPPSVFERAFTANPSHTAPQVSVMSSSYGIKIGKPANLDRSAFPDEHRNQLNDVFTAVMGNHVVKAGFEYNRVIDLTDNLYGGGGQYVYDSMTGFVSDFLNPNHCGAADDTYGTLPCYTYFQQALGPSRFTMGTNDYAAFLADDWRLFSRVTLTVGARYEYEQLPSANPNLLNGDIPQTAVLPHDRNNFGPRLGAAWDIFGKGSTVVRAGYGIYYGRIVNSTIASALVDTGSPNGQLTYSIKPIDAGAPAFPYVFTSSIAGTIKPAAVYFSPHFQNPQVHEAEVSIAQRLFKGGEISASALVSLGRELPNFVDTNIDVSSVTSITYDIRDPSGLGPLPSRYSTKFFSVRGNSNYRQITDIFSETNSKYEAVVLTLRQKFNPAFQMQMHYTYSHAMDFNQNETTFADANDVLDPTDFAAEYGPSNFDVRQRVTGFLMARAPWQLRGVAGFMLNGYSAAPTLSAQTGLPFSMRTAGSVPALNSLNSLNQIATTSGLGYSINGSGGDNRIPGIGRNTYRYPGTIGTDMRVSKKQPLTEKVHLELIGEVFNLLNHQNVTSIDTTGYFIGNSSAAGSNPTLTYNTSGTRPLFGTIQNANSTPLYSQRQIQLGIRLVY